MPYCDIYKIQCLKISTLIISYYEISLPGMMDLTLH